MATLSGGGADGPFGGRGDPSPDGGLTWIPHTLNEASFPWLQSISRENTKGEGEPSFLEIGRIC